MKMEPKLNGVLEGNDNAEIVHHHPDDIDEEIMDDNSTDNSILAKTISGSESVGGGLSEGGTPTNRDIEMDVEGEEEKDVGIKCLTDADKGKVTPKRSKRRRVFSATRAKNTRKVRTYI